MLGAAVALGWRRSGPMVGVVTGAAVGIVAGLAMGGFMMFVASPLLQLPWYAPPRVLATMVMGRAAVADILSFDLVSFFVGVVVLVVIAAALGVVLSLIIRRRDLRAVAAGLTAGLAVWAVLQFFLLPAFFPLVSDKGFPPTWYAVSFALFGAVASLVLVVLARRSRPGPNPRPPAAAQ
jgi:Na+/proline symporter